MAAPLRRHDTYIQQPVVPNGPAGQPSRKLGKRILTRGEYFLIITFLAVAACFSIMLLNTQASIHETTKDIQAIEVQIEETKKQNTDLSIQVSELSTYDRIWEKARELGLKLDNQNVKVVPGQ